MKNYKRFIFLIIFIIACDDVVFDNDSGRIDLIKTAYNLFQSERYDKAEIAFKNALSSGTIVRRDTIFTGLGLTQIRLYKFNDALLNLDSALQINADMTEALFGSMLLQYSFKRDFSSAIVIGNKIVRNDSNWIFSYDNTSNIDDVYLHLALSEFELQNFNASYNYTKKISNKVLDPNASNFISELAKLHSQLSIELKLK